MLKASDAIFVYVNTHIINKIHRCVYTNHDKEYGGLNSTRKGKGRLRAYERIKLEGLIPKKYYNIIPKH